MSWNSLFGWGALAWFIVLAIAEALVRHEGSRNSNGDSRLVTNFGLTIIVLAVSSLLPLANVGASLLGQRVGIGLGPQLGLSWLSLFVLTLAAQSLASYWVHRSMHRVPLLWRVHRVHHADKLVDVSTSLRNHPLELLVTIPVAGLVIVAIGAPPSVVLATQSFFVATTIWEHADIRLPRRLDRAIAFVLVTPRLHRIHHHPERQEHDSNYGNSLTVWDRIFGTLNDKPDRLAVGLERQSARPDHLLDQILWPLHA